MLGAGCVISAYIESIENKDVQEVLQATYDEGLLGAAKGFKRMSEVPEDDLYYGEAMFVLSLGTVFVALRKATVIQSPAAPIKLVHERLGDTRRYGQFMVYARNMLAWVLKDGLEQATSLMKNAASTQKQGLETARMYYAYNVDTKLTMATLEASKAQSESSIQSANSLLTNIYRFYIDGVEALLSAIGNPLEIDDLFLDDVTELLPTLKGNRKMVDSSAGIDRIDGILALRIKLGEQKESAKQNDYEARVAAYWALHKEEHDRLKSLADEAQHAYDAAMELRTEKERALADLELKRDARPKAQYQIDSITGEIKGLEKELGALGLFKGKQKKALRAEIDSKQEALRLAERDAVAEREALAQEFSAPIAAATQELNKAKEAERKQRVALAQASKPLKEPNVAKSDELRYKNEGRLTGHIKADDFPFGITEIDWSSFEDANNVLSVEIPEGVTCIYGDAFKNCTRLESVHLPTSLQRIEVGAFEGCAMLESIDLPQGLKSLKWSAFRKCASLRQITIPEGITELSGNVFEGCTSLEIVTLPESLQETRGAPFGDCTSLVEINIPSGLKRIGDLTFQGCSSLKTIVVPKDAVIVELNGWDDSETFITKEFEFENGPSCIWEE